MLVLTLLSILLAVLIARFVPAFSSLLEPIPLQAAQLFCLETFERRIWLLLLHHGTLWVTGLPLPCAAVCILSSITVGIRAYRLKKIITLLSTCSPEYRRYIRVWGALVIVPLIANHIAPIL